MTETNLSHPWGASRDIPERLLRTDGCPECCTRLGNLPRWVRDDGTGAGFFAWYLCHCGHQWTTAWADE